MVAILSYNKDMIAQKYRFHGHGSVRYVLKNGVGKRNHSMSIKIVDNSRRTYSRVSIIVSKKVLHDAVQRNRVRRRLYELVRTRLLPLLTDSKQSGAKDIVITVYEGGIINEAPGRLVRDFENLIEPLK